MIKSVKRFVGCLDGSVMVEFAVVLPVLLTLTFGMLDFSLALYQWNNASKAAELGSRIAAVSSPVASNISTLNPTSAFSIVCTGAAASVTCTNGGTADFAALQAIVYGRGKTACSGVVADQLPAMCNIYSGLTTANVKVTYQQSAYATAGLGYSKRSGGPVPTITVELTGLTFRFLILGGLLNFTPMTMPTMKTTITGEDLATTCGGTNPC